MPTEGTYIQVIILCFMVIILAELHSIASKLILDFPDLVLDYTEDDDNKVVIRRKKMSSIGPTKHPCFNPRLIISYGSA